jgi:phosphoribosylanthranilate isomerase
MPSGGNDIPDAAIAEIAALAPPPVATVLLTAETKADAISAHIRVTNPTAVQIVAHIEPEESARLARLEPHVRRIQAIHVTGDEALDFIDVYSPHIHAFLLDSGRPGEKTPVLGGTGRTHDWAVSFRFARPSTRPVFLAGGLTAENVGDAIRQVRPFGLDLCSSVRTNGQLDPAKLATFMMAVRRTEWALDPA